MGDHCQLCRVGYYGNALSGQAGACRQCPCPRVEGRGDEDVIGTCTTNIDGQPVCDRCPTGYAGDKCNRWV